MSSCVAPDIGKSEKASKTLPTTRVMKGATAPDKTDVATAGNTRKRRSWRVKKEKRSFIEAFGGARGGMSNAWEDAVGVSGSLSIEPLGLLIVSSTASDEPRMVVKVKEVK